MHWFCQEGWKIILMLGAISYISYQVSQKLNYDDDEDKKGCDKGRARSGYRTGMLDDL